MKIVISCSDISNVFSMCDLSRQLAHFIFRNSNPLRLGPLIRYRKWLKIIYKCVLNNYPKMYATKTYLNFSRFLGSYATKMNLGLHYEIGNWEPDTHIYFAQFWSYQIDNREKSKNLCESSRTHTAITGQWNYVLMFTFPFKMHVQNKVQRFLDINEGYSSYEICIKEDSLQVLLIRTVSINELRGTERGHVMHKTLAKEDPYDNDANE